MTRLLDEIDQDLDEHRKRNPSDFSVKNVTQWWSLERERLVVRHGEKTVLRKPRVWRGGRTLTFFAGFGVAVVLGLFQRLL